ncbi:MAG: hypothetical protein E6Q97_01255 [Desulfurellales bacterium]|jgi:hypothetical protein|nr:MAG: hypothetical protein E6Q97_01255 [Desulfurellales bacterium]
MANVKVVIQEVVQGAGKIDSVTRDLNTLEQQQKKTQATSVTLKNSYTEFLSALGLVQMGLQYAKAAFDATIGAQLEYANAVRQLSNVNGESAESTSRLIQVMDDFGISSDKLLTSVRAMTSEGKTLTVETLAAMADEYGKLGSQQEKNEYIIKNLGRAGLEYAEVLEKGGDAIRKMNDEVDESLVLNEKNVNDARRLEVAWDTFKDTLQGVGSSISNQLMPILDELVNSWTWALTVAQKFSEAAKNGTVDSTNWFNVLRDTAHEIDANTAAMAASGDEADEMGESVNGLTGEMDDAQAAAQRFSAELTGMLSSMFTIQKDIDNFAKTTEDLAKKDAELAAEKNKLTLEMWEQQRAGKLTNDEYLRYVQQLDAITQKEKENQQSKAGLEEQTKKAAQQRVYDLTQQRLAADGLIDSGEFEYLQDIAVQRGLVSRAAADQAIAESRAADEMVANFQKTQPVMNQTLTTMQQIAAFDGKYVNFGVNFNQTGQITTPTPYSYNPGVAGGGASLPPATRRPRSRDSGGSGVAGTPYMIGTGAQPEMFVPNTNGTFVPNADKMGATYNITINNPIPERSENSVRNTLKKLSYLGTAA